MIKRLKLLIIFIVVFSLLFTFGTRAFASSELNMNTSQAVSQASAENTSTVLQSVSENDETTAGISISDVINILLIAIGFVIILFAVAILIRLKNK